MAKKNTKKNALIRSNDEYTEVPLSKIKQHPRNPRRGDVARIAESVKQHGFVGPIVVQKSTGLILAGNHRYLAAKELGLTRLPVLYVDMDEDQATRFLLSDNRVTDFSGWDEEGLNDMLNALHEESESLVGTGFDMAHLDAFLETPTVESTPTVTIDLNDGDEADRDLHEVHTDTDDDEYDDDSATFFSTDEDDIEDVATELSKSDAAEESKTVMKQLLLVYTPDEFERVTKSLNIIVEDIKVKSYAEAVIYLVNRYKED